MPPKKKRVPARSPKADTISSPPKGKRKSYQGDIEVGSPDKRPDLFGVPKATEIFEGDDEEIAISPSKKKRKAVKRCAIAIKRRGRPPKKSNKQTDCETKPSTQPDGVNGNDRDKEECEEEAKAEEELSCSHCNKRFKSQLGLKYHTDKKVCQTATKEVSSRAKKVKTEDASPSPSKKPERGRKTLRSLKSVLYAEDGGVSNEDNVLTDEYQEAGTKRKRKATSNKAAQKCKLKRGKQSKKTDHRNEHSDGESDKDLVADDDAKKRRKDSARSNKLKKGAQFITKFGIVEVIADDRLPEDHCKSTIDKNAVRSFLKRRDRFHERKRLLLDQIAAGTRNRREELKKMYLESKSTINGNGTSLPQQKVWALYCKSLTSKQILTEGLSWVCGNAAAEKANRIQTVEEDPRSPKDHYLDRIVECKLVQDKRDVLVVTIGDRTSSDDAHESNDLEFRREIPSNPKNPFPMRLFLSRRELTREYDSSKPNYKCDSCGKEYTYRSGIIVHMTACKANKENDKEKRHRHIEAIESRALSELGCCSTLLTNLHGVVNEPRHTGDPAFGNPHKIKEHKMHKYPPYLVFDAQRSSMYPEIYISMGFKRGSQNRNHFKMIKQDSTYTPSAEKRRAMKKMKKKAIMMDPGASPAPALSAEVSTAKKPVAKQVTNERKKRSAKKAKKETPDIDLPSSDVPALPSYGDHYDSGVHLDNNFDKMTDPMPLDGPSDSLNGGAMSAKVSTAKKPTQKQDAKPVANQVTNERKKRSAKKTQKETPDLDLPSSDMPPLPAKGDRDYMHVDFDNDFDNVTDPMPVDGHSDSLNGAIDTINNSTSASHSRNKRCRKGISISKKKSCVVIDSQVLAAECEAGRYPTINRFHGEHDIQCALCKQPGDTPLLNCDFCKNSFHQLCLDKNMLQKDPQVIIRENEPDDTPMCNKCISTCLFRRWRAENRRLTKWQHELAKAGLGSVPEAASLREEVNLNKMNGANDDQEIGGAGEDDKPTYESCPDGGPGGLICCSYCTAAYSRFLSNTAKEMEAQTVSKVGQEVSEILELLEDAKQRLQRASYVSQSNEERRGILDQNQTAHDAASFA